MSQAEPSNNDIASQLDHIAGLLDSMGANPFRVSSYRRGAATVREHQGSVAKLARESRSRLQELPGIGSGLAGTIREYVRTGSISLLERLETQMEPQKAFRQLPGIGPELASRIVSDLGIRTLEELERAAHDGRLETLRGFGAKRVRAVRDSLAVILSRSTTSGSIPEEESEPDDGPPDVGLLLALDRSYREKADAGELRTIAPKRFNPEGEAWLPIMEVSRPGYDFTLLFSNTPLAHELDATHDWVVIYWENHEDGQCTVVTSNRGDLAGKRVVRGREPECRRYYESGPEVHFESS